MAILQVSLPTKLDTLQAASAQKTARLEEEKRAQEAQLRQDYLDQVAARNEAAFAKDEELGTLTGQAKQLGGAALTSASRVAGELVAAPATLASGFDAMSVPDDAQDIYLRQRKTEAIKTARLKLMRDSFANNLPQEEQRAQLEKLKQAEEAFVPPSQQELEYLNTPANIRDQQLLGRLDPIKKPSYKELLDSSNKGFDQAERIKGAFNDNDFIAGVLNPLNREKQTAELKQAYDKHKGHFASADKAYLKGNHLEAIKESALGVAKLAKDGAGNVWDNPASTFEFLAENAVQLSLGAVSRPLLSASNLAYAARTYEESINEYRAEHDGAMPSQEDQLERFAWSMSVAPAEQLGERLQLKAFTKARKVDVAKEASKGNTRKVGEAAGNIGSTAAGNTVTEAGTEVYQTYVEEAASKQKAVEDGSELFTAGVLGGASGGTIAGTGRTVAELAGTTDKHVAIDRQKTADKAKQQDLQNAARETGDVSGLTDTKNKETYAPVRAGVALAARIQDEALTPEERDKSRAELDKVVTGLSAQVEALQATQQANSPEKIAELKTAIQEREERLANPPADMSAETQARTREKVALLREELEATQIYNKKQAKTDAQEITEIRKHLEQLATVQQTTVAPKAEKVTALVDAIEKPSSSKDVAVSDSTPPTDELIELMMENPDSVDTETATRLAEDTLNSFTPNQREYLAAYSAARAARNALQDMQGVSNDIFVGGEGYKGIGQYQQEIPAALRAGDTALANRLLTNLYDFARGHRAKAANLQKGLAQVHETGKTHYLVPSPASESTWRLTDTAPAGFALNRKGALKITPNTARLAENTEAEAKALSELYRELKAHTELSKSARKAKISEAAAKEAIPEAQETPAQPVKNETQSKVAPKPEKAQAASEEVVATEEDADAELARLVQSRITEEDTQQEEGDIIEVGPRESGQLALLKEKAKQIKGTLSLQQFKALNLVQAYFTQSAGRKGDKTYRPLVVDKDFMAQWNVAPELVEEYLALAEGEEFTERQEKLLTLFNEFFLQWDDSLQENIAKAKYNKDYRYTNYIEYLRNDVDEQGEIIPLAEGQAIVDENVRAAILLAAFNWIAENAGGDGRLRDSEINALLSRDDKTPVTPEERNALGILGMRDKIVIANIGKKAAQALGLQAHADAPANTQVQLEQSLGAHAVAILLEAEFIEREPSNSRFLHQEQWGEYNPATKHLFFRVVRNWDGKTNPPVAGVQLITDTAKETGSVLARVFGVEADKVDPEYTVPEWKQKHTKGTHQGIPEYQQEALRESATHGYQVRLDMHQATEALDDATLAFVLGQRTNPYTHVTREESVKAKNDGLAQEWVNFTDFKQRLLTQVDPKVGLNKLFYFMGSVWRQQRIGLSANQVNPQTSKAHRRAITMVAWQTTVDARATEGEQAAILNRFKLAVAQAMGIKTDQLSRKASIAAMEAQMASEEIAAAVTALRRLPKLAEGEKFTEAEQQAIQQAVDLGGEDMHSYDGLLNWAQYLNAAEEGTTFNTDITYEVDGVANGPGLAQSFLGTMAYSEGQRFGFYPKESNIESYPQWKSLPGSLDQYEIVAATIAATLRNYKAAALAPLWAFTGELATPDGAITKEGRKLLKGLVTPLVFGSGMIKTEEDMATHFIEQIYEKLEKLANDNKPEEMLTALNHIAFMAGAPRIETLPSYEEIMQKKLSAAEEQKIKTYYKNILGKAAKQAANEHFEAFMTVRRQLNLVAQTSWEYYNTIYEHFKAKLIEQKMRADELPGSKDKAGNPGKPYQELSPEDERALRAQLKAIEPVVHTAMSKLSDDLSAGLYMAKMENIGAAADEASMYGGEVKFGKDIPLSRRKTTEKNTRRSFKTRGAKTQEISPGVAVVIGLVHAADSFISTATGREVKSLNLHDARLFGLNGMTKGSVAFNRATLQVLSDYSLPLELAAALERSVVGMEKLFETLPAEEVTQLKAKLARNVGKDNKDKRADNPLLPLIAMARTQPEAFLQRIRVTAIRQELAKQRQLKTYAHINQYAMAGGSYTLTAEDYTRIDATIKQLETELATYAEKPATVETEAVPTKQDAPVIPPKTGDTPWGKLGAPVIESDPRIEKLFAGKKSVPVRTVMARLNTLIGQETSLNKLPSQKAFYAQLLRQLKRALDPAMPVNYITPATPTEAKKTRQYNARGWYSNAKQGSINIKSSEFTASGITAELLLHEMTHAALAQTIQAAKKLSESGKALSAEEQHQVNIYNELEALRVAAAEEIKSRKLTQFKPAIKDVHELVSWGMTNFEFMSQVLHKLEFETQHGDKIKESGFQYFVRKLVSIFFRKAPNRSTEMMRISGMSAMIVNTGLLFEEAGATPLSDPNVEQQEFHMEAVEPEMYTVDQTYQALGQNQADQVTDPRYDSHLREALRTVVSVAYGPYGVFEAEAKQKAPMTADEVFVDSLQAKEYPFASAASAQLDLNHQEAFVMESVEVTMREAMTHSSTTRNELRKLFQEAKAQIQPQDFYPGDWANATNEQREQAQATHDFIFQLQRNQDGSSDFLSRFVAIGTAYKPLHDMLRRLEPKSDRETYHGKNLAQALKLLFERAAQALAYLMTGTNASQHADSRLRTLAEKLARLERRKQRMLKQRQATTENALTAFVDSLHQTAKDKVEKLGRSKLFRNSKSGIIRASGALASTVAGERVDLLMQGIKKAHKGSPYERLGTLAQTIAEIRGADANTLQFHTMLREANHYEQQRKQLREETADMVAKSFGRKLTKDESSALTRVVLRTDMASLMKDYSLAEIEQLLRDPQALEAAITKQTQQLTGEFARYYDKGAKDLGYFMATGKNRNAALMMNAHNLAFMGGTQYLGQVKKAQGDQAIAVLDPLITLYALKYMPPELKKPVSELMRSEAARTDKGNGVELVLAMHAKLQEEAKENLFEGSAYHFMKGYTKEIFDPHVSIAVVTQAEGAALKLAGYTEEGIVDKDPNDPEAADRYMYVLKDAGLPSRVTGIMSNTGMRSRGSLLHTGISPVTGEYVNGANVRKNQRMAAARRTTIQAAMTTPRSYDPSKTTNTYMAPVLNPAGEAVNHRYLMQEKTKDIALERDNRVEVILGVMTASAFDKIHSAELNRKAVKALHMQYREEYQTNPEDYVVFGPDSRDPSIREAYHLLPEDTKLAIKDRWGQNMMLVRKDILDMTFGYRKFSLADMFEQSEAERGIAKDILTGVLEKLLGPSVSHRIRKYEDIWQGVVKEVKDIWVIKNLFTLMGNVGSNVTVLLWAGVPAWQIVRDHVVGITSALIYQRDRKEHYRLSRLLEIGQIQGDRKAVEQRLLELEDALKRSPVSELIDAGMFQTIVEDIEADEDRYSYKGKLVRKVEAKTQWAPDWTKATAKTLYMAHATPLYRVMERATHLSDFVARYTLHNHLTTRKHKPLSKEDSLQWIADAFVNYDIPTSRNLQYLNDMGLIWFTKYYLRIQKVIYRLYREQPAHAMGVLLLNNFFPGLGNIMDSGFWGRMENPFSVGALHYPGALDEIMTVRAAMSPF